MRESDSDFAQKAAQERRSERAPEVDVAEDLADAATGISIDSDLHRRLRKLCIPVLKRTLEALRSSFRELAQTYGAEHPETIAAWEGLDRLFEMLQTHFASWDRLLEPLIERLATVNCPAQAAAVGAHVGALNICMKLGTENRLIQCSLADLSAVTRSPEDAAGERAEFASAFEALRSFEGSLSEFLRLEEESLLPQVRRTAGSEHRAHFPV